MQRLILILLAALPLFAQNDVGEVAFANSGAAEAQAPFRRGLALLHNFEYPLAADEFRKAQQIDPNFAMAYWGEAMTHTHPIWFQQDLDAARAVLQRLGTTAEERLAKVKTEREKDYLRTLDVLYGEGSKNDRDFKYADAMGALHAKYPDDVDAAAFHALAILGTAHQGRDFAKYMRSAAILEEVFPANRNHPGVLHYLIHSYDDPLHAPLGLRAARLYGAVAPKASHALHMTSHIFVAMGMWDDVIDANRRAVAATNELRAKRNRQKADCGHYPTWLHYGHLQKNDAVAARKALDACRASALEIPFEQAGPMDSKRSRVTEYADMRAHHVAAGHALSDADRIAIPEEFPRAQYTAAYADVMAAKDAESLKQSVARVRALHTKMMELSKGDDNPSERQRADVILQESEALLLAATGKRDEAIQRLEAAKKLEESMSFDFGPPLIAKPASELLGDQLLLAGRATEAASAYRSALARMPGRVTLVTPLAKLTPAKAGETTAKAHVH
jgi:tetratricopeptide (TPR) repeat protein